MTSVKDVIPRDPVTGEIDWELMSPEDQQRVLEKLAAKPAPEHTHSIVSVVFRVVAAVTLTVVIVVVVGWLASPFLRRY